MIYRAYGLRLASELPFPELASARGPADAELVTAAAEPAPPHDWRCPRPDVATFSHPEARIDVEGGRRIVVRPAPAADRALLRLVLLGPAMALLLDQRGRLVLHANTVRVGDGAVVIVGEAGQGKSTLSAALVRAGHELVADDVTALDGATALPGIGRLKLWPDSARALGVCPAALPKVRADEDKRLLHVPVAAAPVPVRAVITLDRGAPRLERLGRQGALQELVRHSFTVRVLHPERRAAHLAACAALVTAVPVVRLVAPRSFASLDETIARVEAEWT